MYLVGEALVGDGAELAHIDLLMGEKEGPIGTAFANAISQLSQGHTPLLAVVRPNLLTKPVTLVIPKVTLKDMHQVNEMFGPVQAAVRKPLRTASKRERSAVPIPRTWSSSAPRSSTRRQRTTTSSTASTTVQPSLPSPGLWRSSRTTRP